MLQNLLYCLAFQFIAQGWVTHDVIPDTPLAESERRQIVFGSAIGIPTFFVRQDTHNLLLKRIIARTARTRASRRYPGYIRVYNAEYRRALLDVLRQDGAGLIEMFGMKDTIDDLTLRLDNPDYFGVAGRLTGAICAEAGFASPLRAEASEFNRAAERYYRGSLRAAHVDEALRFFEDDIIRLQRADGKNQPAIRHALRFVLKDRDEGSFISGIRKSVNEESASLSDIRKLIYLLIITIYEDKANYDYTRKPVGNGTLPAASLC